VIPCTREAEGIVSQQLYANTSANCRESSPTLFAAGYIENHQGNASG